jgi:hypothetical protein
LPEAGQNLQKRRASDKGTRPAAEPAGKIFASSYVYRAPYTIANFKAGVKHHFEGIFRRTSAGFCRFLQRSAKTFLRFVGNIGCEKAKGAV